MAVTRNWMARRSFIRRFSNLLGEVWWPENVVNISFLTFWGKVEWLEICCMFVKYTLAFIHEISLTSKLFHFREVFLKRQYHALNAWFVIWLFLESCRQNVSFVIGRSSVFLSLVETLACDWSKRMLTKMMRVSKLYYTDDTFQISPF